MRKVLLDGIEYIEYTYKNESEFEKDIVTNSKKIFGEKTHYIDIKKRLKGKYQKDSIPDGYLFDYTSEKSPKLYLVENELCEHSVKSHIVPQLLQFALNYKYNLSEIKELIIRNMTEANIDIDLISKTANYRNADDMLTNIITNEKLGVIIPIDTITDELKEIKSLFRFNIELLEFKKYYNEDKSLYFYDEFNEEIEIINDNHEELELDTIIVPAEKEGFEAEFIGNNCWYAVSIGINRIDKLKYIAAYQKTPIGAITHYAEISNIDVYKDTGKYIIYFKDDAKELDRPIKLSETNRNKAPQSRVYTNISKILNANKQTTLDDIFKKIYLIMRMI